ncbi:hypothetical protein [Sulfurovum sp.]|nr:hypothetical protein [Sulfurovum sp.]MDY0403688.1 hypothetical protein [Sulfurovum sp.]
MKREKLKTRVTWGFSPVTRTVPSQKRYRRKKMKQETRESIKLGE